MVNVVATLLFPLILGAASAANAQVDGDVDQLAAGKCAQANDEPFDEEAFDFALSVAAMLNREHHAQNRPCQAFSSAIAEATVPDTPGVLPMT